MSRVENAAFEAEVASSLLSPAEQEQEQAQPEQHESQYSIAGDDLLDEAIREQADDRFVLGDEESERLRSERGEQEPREQPQAQERPERGEPQEREQTQQAAEPTPEQVQAGVEKLDAGVQEYGLNEPADARHFAEEFCAAFDTDIYKAGVDVGALGGVMAKTTLSALNVYAATGGDLTKMGGIPEQSAQAFAHDLLKGMGVDPRSVSVDASLLARTTLGGMVNFLNTYASYGGKVTDLAKLNDPQAAEFYLQNFLKAFGQEGPVNRETALKFADTCARQILRVLGKVSQINEQRAASQERQPRGRSRGQRVPAQFREGIKGSKAPRFRTNSGAGEPFDDETVAEYHRQHGRL
jgi:hypothetical protein